MSVTSRAVNLLKLSETIQNNRESYNCSTCTQRGYNKDRNCNGLYPPKIKDINNTEVRFTVDKDSVINYCPVIDMLNDDVIFMLDLFTLFNAGFLYTDVVKQPYWYIRAMLELKSTHNKIESDSLKRSSK